MKIGDQVELRVPYKGYRYGTVCGFEGLRVFVELSSGLVLSFYEDELER